MLDAKLASCRQGCNESANSIADCYSKLCKDNAREKLCNVLAEKMVCNWVNLTATIWLQDQGFCLALLGTLEILQQQWQVFWQHKCLGTELKVSWELCRHC